LGLGIDIENIFDMKKGLVSMNQALIFLRTNSSIHTGSKEKRIL